MRRSTTTALLIGLIVTSCASAVAVDGGQSTAAPASPGLTASELPTATERPSADPTARPTATATSVPTPRPTPEPVFGQAPTGQTQKAVVTRVVDGDTIEVQIGGQLFKVRYIGIDTPETVHPGTPVQWMGREASAANRRLVEGTHVVLEKDVSEVDRFGRLLRYVWLHEADGKWRLVNLILVRKGFASVSTYPPDVKYTDALYLPAERRARAAGRGLWGTPPPDPEPTIPPSGGNCDSSYPGVCIPPYPPDLDCADVGFTNFAVVPPDPHGFDGDGDGVGCES